MNTLRLFCILLMLFLFVTTLASCVSTRATSYTILPVQERRTNVPDHKKAVPKLPGEAASFSEEVLSVSRISEEDILVPRPQIISAAYFTVLPVWRFQPYFQNLSRAQLFDTGAIVLLPTLHTLEGEYFSVSMPEIHRSITGKTVSTSNTIISESVTKEETFRIENTAETSQNTEKTIASGVVEKLTVAEYEISGVLLEEVHIELPDTGWVYRMSASDDQNIELLQVKFPEKGTTFVFRFTDTGEYPLFFERQNFTDAASEHSEVLVHVLSSEQTIDSVTTMAETTTNTTGTTGTMADVHTKHSEGVQRGETHEEIITRFIDQLKELDTGIIPAKTMLQITDIAANTGTFPDIADSLTTFLSSTENKQADAILFMLAQSYETNPEYRGIRIAYSLYSQIVNNFPLSPFYISAKDRREHISRHFLFIR